MSLFQTDKEMEQFLKNLQMPNLTSQQKANDMLAIHQQYQKIKTRSKTKRFSVVALASVATVALCLGLFKLLPYHSQLNGSKQNNSYQISAPTPIPPSSISRDADLLWRNGTATHAFVTYNGYFYIATGQLIKSKSELKSELGKISRLGDDNKPWVDLESNYFPLGTLYSMNGIDPSEKIAFQFYSDGNKGAAYGIFVRDTPLAQRDPITVTGAKNNSADISMALANIRNQFPAFKELQNTDCKVSEVVFEPSYGPGARLVYQLPTGQNISIYEYKKNLDSKDLPKSDLAGTNTRSAQKTFDLNGIHWSYFSDDLLRGEQGDYYYEINQSGVPEKQLLDLLGQFKKS